MRRLEIVCRYERLEDEVFDALVEEIRRTESAQPLLDFIAEQPCESISWAGGGVGPVDEPDEHA